MEQKNQVEVVLNYLRTHKKGLTSMKAFWRWRITRLSAKIYELREKGYHIVTKKEPNTFTKGYHGRYFLIKEKDWWE